MTMIINSQRIAALPLTHSGPSPRGKEGSNHQKDIYIVMAHSSCYLDEAAGILSHLRWKTGVCVYACASSLWLA